MTNKNYLFLVLIFFILYLKKDVSGSDMSCECKEVVCTNPIQGPLRNHEYLKDSFITHLFKWEDSLLQSGCINKSIANDLYRIKRILNYEDIGRKDLIYIFNIVFQIALGIFELE